MAGKPAFQPDSDVHITFDDQQKINRFAKHNARLEDYKIELQIKKESLKTLADATEELELFDEDDMIPFLVGEVFISNDLYTTQKLLAASKKQSEKDVSEIEAKCEEIQKVMNELKAQLYCRFGNKISLENDG